MNQRAGKTHRAAMGQDGRIAMFEVIDFFESAKNALEQNGEEDAAFYFEQVYEHLKKNPQKGFKETVSRILGV